MSEQVPSLSRAERQQIQDAFRLFDTENKGVIDPKELKQVVESLDEEEYEPTNRAISEFLRLLKQQREPLDLDQFMSLLTQLRRSSNDLDHVFDLFDVDRKGFITVQDLSKVAADLGETMTEEELQEMIDRANPDHKGRVRREDFVAIMTKQLGEM